MSGGTKMANKKFNLIQKIYETIGTAVLALVFLWILSALITAISPSFGTWTNILLMFVSAVLLIVAIYIRPGDENFVETIPIVIIALGLLATIKTWIPTLPNLGVEFSWTSIAFGLSAIYLADVLVQKAEKYLF